MTTLLLLAVLQIGSEESMGLLDRLAEGWNQGDARKAAECFTEDAVYVEPPDRQLYRGREELYRFFGGDSGRPGAMSMTWRNRVFDEERQIGFGEFTFSYGSQVHGTERAPSRVRLHPRGRPADLHREPRRLEHPAAHVRRDERDAELGPAPR